MPAGRSAPIARRASCRPTGSCHCRPASPTSRAGRRCWRESPGAIGPVDIGILAPKGSLYLTRPTLNNYTATREDLMTAAGELFDVVQKGAVKLAINQTYPLRDAAKAHRDLQDRKTTGSTVFAV